MGNKKRKNSNYVTEKTILAKEKKEKAERNKKVRRTALIITAAALSAALLIGGILALGFGVFGWGKNSQNFKATHHATMVIKDYGTVHIELYGEEAPETVENFVSLANEGFYNGLTFHRIIEGFMAQGGKSDMVSKPTIKGEFSANGIDNDILHRRGVISMARADGLNSASTQFFIVQNAKAAEHLNGYYAAFGKVTSGMDVIDAICKDAKPYDNGSILPSEQPIITSISIHATH